MIQTALHGVMNTVCELAASIIMHFNSLGQGFNAALEPFSFQLSEDLVKLESFDLGDTQFLQLCV